jgi:hypothetical protein
MNMIPKKFQSASAPADADRVIADLISRLRELDARDRAVNETIITVEKTVGAAQFDVTADMAQAEALLEGKKFVASREKPVSQLAALHAERKVIAHAVKIGGSRLHLLTTARSEKIWAAHFSEIAEIEKRRVMLVFELQRINRARETLRAKINKAGGAGYLSTDGPEFLGFGDEIAEIQWAANRLIADGIATRGEIEKARSDG